MKKSSHI